METYTSEDVIERVVNISSQAQPQYLHGLEPNSPLSSHP